MSIMLMSQSERGGVKEKGEGSDIAEMDLNIFDQLKC